MWEGLFTLGVDEVLSELVTVGKTGDVGEF